MENIFLDKELVVLEHLLMPDRGMRFVTTNTKDNTHLHDGTLAYKEVLFTDSMKEAQEACSSLNWGVLPSLHEMEEFYNHLLQEENEN